MPSQAQRRAKFRRVMHEGKTGHLHTGSKRGPITHNPRQIIAIACKESGACRRPAAVRRRKK